MTTSFFDTDGEWLAESEPAEAAEWWVIGSASDGYRSNDFGRCVLVITAVIESEEPVEADLQLTISGELDGVNAPKGGILMYANLTVSD